MSSTYETLFTNIATAIRSKDGISTLMSPSDFPTRLNALSIGNNSKVNITANDYSSSTYKSSCYITCTTSEGYTDTVYGTFSSSGTVSFTLKYIGTYVFHYTCLSGSTEYNWIKNISNAQNEEIYDEEVEYLAFDPSKSTLTENEFITICQNGLQSKMTIGAIITLDNTYQTQWEVIGKNHDGTNGTVDIMSHTNIKAMKFGSSNRYSGSNVHTFCNSTVPNAFTNSTTKSLIKTMDVVSNDATLTGQYGKALSLTEVGYSATQALIEGTNYGLSDYGYRSGVTGGIWFRSRVTGSSDKVWYVYSLGVNKSTITGSSGVLPVIRF